MDPIHPIIPVAPNIPPVTPAPLTGRVTRDGTRQRPGEERGRRRRAPGGGQEGSETYDELEPDGGEAYGSLPPADGNEAYGYLPPADGDDGPGHVDVTA